MWNNTAAWLANMLAAMRSHRHTGARAWVYDFGKAPNTRIVHTDQYRPFAFDKPASMQNISAYCPHILGPGPRHDNRAWRFCTGESPGTMKMHVVVQKDAMFDRGRQHMGATFDNDNIYLMSHPNSMPALHLTNVQRYPKLAQALEPYAAEAQSHFWFGTVQHVLTLYDVLPDDVSIVVAWSPALAKLYGLFDLNMSRIIPFQSHVTYSADALYSIMLEPWSRDMQGGEPVSPQSFSRLKNHLVWVRPNVHTHNMKVVLVNRRDRATRRCSNHEELFKVLTRELARHDATVVEFTGTNMSTTEAHTLFQDTDLVIAPHGGALLNMVFMHPGMGVIEIGYHEPDAQSYRSMRFPPWYFVMAQLLNLNYSLVMAPGAYNAHIQCPVDTVVQAARAYFHNLK